MPRDPVPFGFLLIFVIGVGVAGVGAALAVEGFLLAQRCGGCAAISSAQFVSLIVTTISTVAISVFLAVTQEALHQQPELPADHFSTAYSEATRSKYPKHWRPREPSSTYVASFFIMVVTGAASAIAWAVSPDYGWELASSATMALSSLAAAALLLAAQYGHDGRRSHPRVSAQ